MLGRRLRAGPYPEPTPVNGIVPARAVPSVTSAVRSSPAGRPTMVTPPRMQCCAGG